MKSIIVIVAVLEATLNLVHGDAFYVCPDDDEECINCSNATSCYTLSNYAADGSLSFLSDNTIIYFLGLSHHLNESMNFSQTANLSLYGQKDGNAIISCNDAGFLFEEILSLHIANLSFHNCSRREGDVVFGLLITNVTDLTMDQVTVQNTTGYGLYMSNIYGASSITDSTFRFCREGRDFSGGNVVLHYDQCREDEIKIEMAKTTISHGKSSKYRNKSAASHGLYVHLNCPGVHLALSQMNISANTAHRPNSINVIGEYEDRAPSGGNMALVYDSYSKKSIVDIQNSQFMMGQALFGGGMFVIFNNSKLDYQNVLSIVNSVFSDNLAYINGGGLYLVKTKPDETFLSSGPCEKSHIFLANTWFFHNQVDVRKDAAAAIMLYYDYDTLYASMQNSDMSACAEHSTTISNCTFQENDQLPCEDATYSQAALYISHHLGELVVRDSTFTENGVTGLAAVHSLVHFEGQVQIVGNKGYRGGGLVLCEGSRIIMGSSTTLNISNNQANLTGGGIFVEDYCTQAYPTCFFHVEKLDSQSENEFYNSTSIMLSNNSAQISGTQLYGGTVENCVPTGIFRKLFHISMDKHSLSYISSDPTSVCFCDQNDRPDCSRLELNMTGSKAVFSGESFNVSLATVGQLNGTVPGVISLDLTEINNDKDTASSTLQPLENNCSLYSITLYSSETGLREVKLTVKNAHVNLNRKRINIMIRKTPLGMVNTGKKKESYECIDSLKKAANNGFRCYAHNTTGHIQRPSPYWLGYNIISTNTSTDDKFVVYSYCPYGRCRSETMNISTQWNKFHSDDQCTGDHRGVLCGACKPNYSLIIGSFNCKKCAHVTIWRTIGLSLALALLGLFLIFLLLALNVTVTQGTMSGFLFYANVFYYYRGVFFPHSAPESKITGLNKLRNFFESVIAFANLRFVYGVCFYDGLDLISKTWLQFLLAIYLWILTGFFIWICKKSTWISNRVSGNIVPTLATVLLLSYTDINISVIHALSFAKLASSNGTNSKLVMLYDGNEQFLGKRHIFLFIAGCIFSFLTLLYTLTLLFIQPLQKFSHFKLLRWVNKFKPLCDAYTCPHIIKPHCRFWNGYLLLMRVVLLVFFSTQAGSEFNRVVARGIGIACFIILFTAWALGGVYTKPYLNILSSLHITNLGILSVLAAHYHSSNSSADFKTISSLVSLSILIVTFFCTIFCHAIDRCMKGKLCSKILKCLRKLRWQNYSLAMRGYASVSDDGNRYYACS